MRGTAILLLFVAAGCGEKSSGAARDAGEAAALARPQDGGESVPTAQVPDAGVDDVALPSASADELAGRMKHLLEAIAQDNADLAGDVLFPRDAYAASRDVPDPAKAWEKRVQGAFKRHVTQTRKRVKGIEGAKFVSFELGHSIAQITPKKNGFKKPLWRVRHSKLTFTLDGKTRHLDISEMTAWRGSWYVTQLR